MEIMIDLCEDTLVLTCPVLTTLSQAILIGVDALTVLGTSIAVGAKTWTLQEEINTIERTEGLAEYTPEQDRQM